MSPRFRTAILFLYTLAMALAQPTASDHPAIARYPGSTVRIHRQFEFESYALALAYPPAPPRTLSLEGKVTRIQYGNPAGRSPLEIFRNYEDSLRNAGASVLFRCEPATCGNWPVIRDQRMINMGSQGYFALVARFLHDQRETHAVLAVSPRIHWIHFIEAKPMDAGLVTVDAKAMASALERDGRLSLDSILFETASARLLPPSLPIIAEIARLLADTPALQLEVVGHTDDTGTPAGNERLSADRALAVVHELTTSHRIAANRLRSRGAGQSQPVAPNTSSDGRRRNRRVELIAVR